MTTLVRIHRKGQMTLPRSFRAAMGVSEGSLVELSLKNGKTVITPKVAIDRLQFPNADDEYTPAQRKLVDARLAKADQDIKEGRTYGPFDTAKEMIVDIKERLGKGPAVKQSKRAR